MKAPREFLEDVTIVRPGERERVRDSVDVSTFGGPTISVQTLDEFADEDEEGAAAVLGTAENALVPEGGDVMTYGDGGAGKTTLMLDLALHLAAGDPWLGIPVARPLRVLLIENEGPRPRFRVKLRRKRDAWTGSPLDGRVHVLADPWGQFTYADENWRRVLAAWVRELNLELVICGPLVSAGMDEAGTLQDVRAFLALVDDVRRQAERRFANLLVHHDNKTGKVSGAWEGAGDTLLHVQPQGRGRLRLHVQKARWASEYHGTTLDLLWAEGESFAIEEKEETTDEEVAVQIVAFVSENPGTGWTRVEEATPGVGDVRRRAVRDGLLAAGTIVNVVKDEGVQIALAEVPERRPARLFRADDPTIAHLRPGPDADGTQAASARGERRSERPLRPASRPIGDAGSSDADDPPATRPPDLRPGPGLRRSTRHPKGGGER